MIVLGIDPGFSITGYAVTQKAGFQDRILACGYLPLSSKYSLVVRVGIFHDFIEKMINAHKITHISIETPFLGKNAQTFLKLGYLRGIVYLLANKHNLVLHEFSPREVKRALTGFGAATKEQVARSLFMLFPQLPKPKKEDATDALAISLCGLWQLPKISN